jgi:hypothetical protein
MLRRLIRPRGRRVPLPILWLIGIAGVVVGAALARSRRRPADDWTTDWTRTAQEASDSEVDIPEAPLPPDETTPTASDGSTAPGLRQPLEAAISAASPAVVRDVAAAPPTPPVVMPVPTPQPAPTAPLASSPEPAEPPNRISDRTRTPDPGPEPGGMSRLGILLLLTIVIVSIALLFYYLAVR